jgi:BMFP domain-containing protein YqiC
VIALLGFVATLVLIRTRDSKAHMEMANAEAEAGHAEAASVGA